MVGASTIGPPHWGTSYWRLLADYQGATPRVRLGYLAAMIKAPKISASDLARDISASAFDRMIKPAKKLIIGIRTPIFCQKNDSWLPVVSCELDCFSHTKQQVVSNPISPPDPESVA